MRDLLILVSAALLFLTACTSSGSGEAKDNPLLQEAAKVHQQIIDTQKEFDSELEALVQRRNAIEVQGRALTESEMTFVQSSRDIEAEYAEWKENVVEVPGFEHAHDHGHDHDHHHHHHGPAPELTPEDMLQLQKDLLASLEDLQQRAADL